MWYETEYGTRPTELDSESSAVYVYVRKDIHEITREEETLWACMEQKIKKADWEFYDKLINHDVEITEVQDAVIELAEIIAEG